MRVAPLVVLNIPHRKTLEQWARSRSLPARQVERAQVVLLAAEGKTDLEIAAALRISNQRPRVGVNASCSWAFQAWKKTHPDPGANRRSFLN